MLRMSGLLSACSGARSCPVKPRGGHDYLGVVKFLVASGVADIDAKDLAGFGLMHHCAGKC